jgi:NADH dehydrogenase [ubiquinone] 1 alpha subcomplex assembly factor 6
MDGTSLEKNGRPIYQEPADHARKGRSLSPLSANALSVRRHDRERFVTALFAEPARREDLFTLYAFNSEIARVRETVSEPVLGQIRLQWWRDNLDALWQGRTVGHPVADALAEMLARQPLPRPLVDRLVEAREFDLQDRPPQTLAELTAYIEDSAAGLAQLAALLLGGGDAASQEAARLVGQAWGLLGLMRAHAYHIKSRRLFLPAAWLAEQGLDIEDLYAGASPPALARLAEQWAGQVAGQLRAARRLRREVTKAARPALLPARLADHYLAGLRAARYDLLDRGWSQPNGRPLALLWSSALGRF